jgi:hypothetical protein
MHSDVENVCTTHHLRDVHQGYQKEGKIEDGLQAHARETTAPSAGALWHQFLWTAGWGNLSHGRPIFTGDFLGIPSQPAAGWCMCRAVETDSLFELGLCPLL